MKEPYCYTDAQIQGAGAGGGLVEFKDDDDFE
jgi:hypothetical protein